MGQVSYIELPHLSTVPVHDDPCCSWRTLALVLYIVYMRLDSSIRCLNSGNDPCSGMARARRFIHARQLYTTRTSCPIVSVGDTALHRAAPITCPTFLRRPNGPLLHQHGVFPPTCARRLCTLDFFKTSLSLDGSPMAFDGNWATDLPGLRERGILQDRA